MEDLFSGRVRTLECGWGVALCVECGGSQRRSGRSICLRTFRSSVVAGFSRKMKVIREQVTLVWKSKVRMGVVFSGSPMCIFFNYDIAHRCLIA